MIEGEPIKGFYDQALGRFDGLLRSYRATGAGLHNLLLGIWQIETLGGFPEMNASHLQTLHSLATRAVEAADERNVQSGVVIQILRSQQTSYGRQLEALKKGKNPLFGKSIVLFVSEVYHTCMKLTTLLFALLPSQPVYAHCDIPCGIYDPHEAQVAAHTVIRMTQLIMDAHDEDDAKKLTHSIARYTKVKEEHAEKVKHEVRVIWGDYFKPEMLKDHPDFHELVFKIMKTASKARQEINLEAAQELLSLVQEFSEIFWKTKGRETVRVASGYPTNGELVLQK